jgi:hypothetical protein
LKSWSRQPRKPKCTRGHDAISAVLTSSRRRQGHCYVTAVDGVMLRTGYVNSTVRTFAMLFSVATVVRPRRIPSKIWIGCTQNILKKLECAEVSMQLRGLDAWGN